MTKTAIITFNDGHQLTINEGDALQPFSWNEKHAGLGLPFIVPNHHHDGLITPLIEFFMTNDFFISEDTNKAYKCNSVIRIEQR